MPSLIAAYVASQWATGLAALRTTGIGDTLVTDAYSGSYVIAPKSGTSLSAWTSNTGKNDGCGNSDARPSADKGYGNGNWNAVGIGNQNGISIAPNATFAGPGAAPPLALTPHGGAFCVPISYAGCSGPSSMRHPTISLTVTVSNVGNHDGDNNQVTIGSHDNGNDNGNHNAVLIGDNNGVGISYGNGVVVQSGTSLIAGNACNQTQSPLSLLSSGFSLAASHFGGIPINVIFESLQITITDSGNDNGDGNTSTVGNANSGSYNGNNNIVSIGNSNGVTISALNSAGAKMLSQLVQIEVSGSGNYDGNGNMVGIGDYDFGSGNGNGNGVLIGNSNGVMISAGSLQGENGLPSPFVSTGAGGVTIADLGTYLYSGLSNPLNVISESAVLSLDGQENGGAGLNGSFNGNGNIIDIGNANGVNLAVGLGSGLPGDDLVSEAVLINVLNSGNNDGNGNAVGIGNQNGAGASLSNLLAQSNWSPSVGGSPLGSQGTPGWANFNLAAALKDLIGEAPSSSPTNLVFESIGITVVGSGNNDGNLNTAILGSQNGGSMNGNANAIAIGNDNGVAIYV